ncbi:DUF1499 domain-containing protein [Aquisalimonas lutea]|uniref:DUF1499 domain-containing protein n=1 Tax=Aquisalimonas lutea TaxID=1327750 RepID=UPI0025B4B577|nr:DUF1499 domain-containing protein [Aquisalimonas lutea]MDN3518928.1 DUF1499 domain-containing protein [Aquisalimonas lutea]
MSGVTRTAGTWGRAAAGLGLGLGALAGLAALLPGPWYQLRWLSLGAAFTMVEWGGWLGLAAMAVGLAGVVLALVARRRGLAAAAGLAVAMGAAGAAWPLYLQVQADAVPPIHDITTDTEDPPAFDALVDEREVAPNAVAYPGGETAEQQRTAYPDLDSRVVAGDLEAVFDRAEEAARLMQWRIVAADASRGRIEAVATTPWFGFRDDVVVRLRQAGDEVVIDVRSASRIGRGDLGVNAARIREYLATLDGLGKR